MTVAVWTIITLLLVASSTGLKEHDFRKCKDTPFCRAHRALQNHSDGGWAADASTVQSPGDGTLRVHKMPAPA